jgi:hypothetical protein
MCVFGERKAMPRMFFAGNLFLLLASACKLLLVRHLGVPDGIGDGITGLFYGAAIGCLLLAIRKRGPRTAE